MAATQYVDIIGSGFVSGVPNFYANCRVYYDGTQILHVGPLYVNWPAPPPPVRAGVSVDVTAFGAAGNGTADDTAAIAAAINAVAATASAAGEVYFPPGIYRTSGNVLQSKVHLRGGGIDATVIKLNDRANADLFSANTSLINLSASLGTGNTGGINTWSISDMTLDGNRDNQTGGTSYPLHFYGYGYRIQNVIIKNGYSGGNLCDWNGGTEAPAGTNFELCSLWSNVWVYDNNNIGFQMGGPHDSHFYSVISYKNISHGIHLAPNCSASSFTNCHMWSPQQGNNAISWLVESADNEFINCDAEGSDNLEIALLGSNNIWLGGRIFASATANTIIGMQLGQSAGGSPIPHQILQSGGVTTASLVQNCLIDTYFEETRGGVISFTNESNNTIRALCNLNGGSAYTGGTAPAASTGIQYRVNGLTPDGSIGKGGGQRFVSKSFTGFTVANLTTDYFGVDTYDGVVDIVNGASLTMYSDAYTTVTLQLKGGTICYAQSSTTPDPGNNGTITTAGVGLARVTPAANRTGVILQAGTQPGQHVIVVNNSASFTVQFAASGTSHVALGTGLTIAVNGKQVFVWDSVAALWY